MGYIQYHISSKVKIKWYASKKGAMIGTKASNRNAGAESYAAMEENEFEIKHNGMVATTNLMTGKTVAIRAQDKGTIVDPGTERYWTI